MRHFSFRCDKCPQCTTKDVQPDFDEDSKGDLRPHLVCDSSLCESCDYPITPNSRYKGPFGAVSADICAIRTNDPALHSCLELILYPSLWLLFFQRISHVFYNLHLYFIARFINMLARWLFGADLHPGALIYPGVFIDHALGVVVGESSIIGSGTLIYQGATIGGTGHKTEPGTRRHPLIGEDCVIGAGAKVLGSVTIGRGVRVGAGAVLLKDAPAFTTMVGIPAKAVRGATTGVRGGKLEHTQLPDVDGQYDSKVDIVCLFLNQLMHEMKNKEDVIRAIEASHPGLIEQLEDAASHSQSQLNAHSMRGSKQDIPALLRE